MDPNNPIDLLILFAGVVVFWAAAGLAIVLLMQGGTRGRHASPPPLPHGYDQEWPTSR